MEGEKGGREMEVVGERYEEKNETEREKRER